MCFEWWEFQMGALCLLLSQKKITEQDVLCKVNRKCKCVVVLNNVLKEPAFYFRLGQSTTLAQAYTSWLNKDFIRWATLKWPFGSFLKVYPCSSYTITDHRTGSMLLSQCQIELTPKEGGIPKSRFRMHTPYLLMLHLEHVVSDDFFIVVLQHLFYKEFCGLLSFFI